MNKKIIKKLRILFEKNSGFNPGQRTLGIYKKYWRKFKKDMRKIKEVA